jgi:hypothetical protein
VHDVGEALDIVDDVGEALDIVDDIVDTCNNSSIRGQENLFHGTVLRTDPEAGQAHRADHILRQLLPR